MPSCKISLGQIADEKWKTIPNLQHCQFEQYGWKVEYELAVKYLENLAIEKICCYFEWCWTEYRLIFRLWVIHLHKKELLDKHLPI